MENLDFPLKVSIYFHYVREQEFETILRIVNYFKKKGYEIACPNTFVNSPTKKMLFLSFDDNYGSWIKLAEFLSLNLIYGTFYVNSGVILDFSTLDERINYFKRIRHNLKDQSVLTASDVIKIKKLGHNIGGHTSDHYPLTMITLKDSFNQIISDKKRLEHIINENVIDFSFPFGMPKFFNNELKEYCLSIGYETIAKAVPCMLYKSEKDKCIINRTNWRFNESFEHNLNNLKINAQTFIDVIGKSPIG